MTNVLSETKRTLKNWWVFLLFGALFIAMGIWVFMTPAESFVALAILFAVLILANGVGGLVFCLANWKYLDGRGWHLAGAGLEIVIGIMLIIQPIEVLAQFLAFFIGFWLMFRAVYLIAAAFEIRNYGFKDWGWVLAFGILLLILSFMVISNPAIGVGFVVALTAISFMMVGGGYIAFGLMLKRIKGGTLDKIDEFKQQLKDAAAEPAS